LPEERQQKRWIHLGVRSCSLCDIPEALIAESTADCQAQMDGASVQIRDHIVHGNRPAGIGNPGPLLEIDFVKPRASASPGVGTAPDDPIANRPLVLHAGPTDVFDIIERIDVCIPLPSAAFKQDHLKAGV
jgi:hypothetical protein